jgi:hypothetical protein
VRFSIKLIRTREQLQKVVVVRASSYKKHIPTLAETLGAPEDADFKNATITIGCEDNESKEIVGSVRITLNQFEPLPLEMVFPLDPHISSQLIAEATRLVIPASPHARLVKLLLIKSTYLYCHALQVKWLVLCAREPLDREYEKLGMVDVSGGLGFRRLPYADNILHRALGLDVVQAERNWSRVKHPLYNFMAKHVHKEIKIFDSVRPMWEQPRENSGNQENIKIAESTQSLNPIPSKESRH